jgi:protein O-mannosyl-transferase
VRKTADFGFLLPPLLAVVMGAPSICGGFLAVDDVWFVRDHALVNHPSWNHLAELFAIPHRDLYQPVPLATFALNFAVINQSGLTAEATGPRAGAWVFHLTNILIHALNAWLVWRLLRDLTGRDGIGIVAGVLFAVHPLNVECVAWLCGRMMMLSTTFTLAALIAAAQSLERVRVTHAVTAAAAAVLAMMSKVNVALPVLMLLIPFARRRRPTIGWWCVFAINTLVTGLFAIINFWLSRGRIETGAEALQGSPLVRTAIALGWYVSRYVVPVGLAPWHPTETLVTAATPGFVLGVVAVALLVIATVLCARFSRLGLVGVVWFLAAIAVTLPLIPSRNSIAAERYTYLPAIGFDAIVAAGCVGALSRLRRRRGAAVVTTMAGASAVVALLAVAWVTTAYYRDNVAYTRRTAELYPNHAGVWTRVAWAHYEAGEYAQAVAVANIELAHQPASARSDVWQVQGLALLRAGDVNGALAKLQNAVEIAPTDGMAKVRLATALVESGRLEEALPHYRAAAEALPKYNPGLMGLAQTYRKLGRPGDAAGIFAQVLANNPYDATAVVALAEIELAGGQTARAVERLERLLSWMPENAVAHANLGLGYLKLGRTQEALREYRGAVDRDPTLVPARLNLATLLVQLGAAEDAAGEFRALVEQTAYSDSSVLLAASDFLVARGDLPGAAGLWQEGLRRHPDDVTMASWYAWVSVLAEQWGPAGQVYTEIRGSGSNPPAAVLTGILLDVQAGRPDAAVETTARLCADAAAETLEARQRLQQALKAFSERHPENPWPYYLMIPLLQADGRPEGAKLAAEAFGQVCTDPNWVQRAQQELAHERARQ